MTHAELTAAGVEIDTVAYQRLCGFVERVRRVNRRINLLSARAAREMWPAHICDSLALLPILRASSPARLLDLGTGGGLPGVPLACACPSIQVTLLDATGKKIGALRRICDQLGLANVATVWGRAEELVHDPAYRESFDVVTARALAPLARLAEYAAGYVRPGGRCHFFKSCQVVADELAGAEPTAGIQQLTFADTTTYSLPAGHGDRALVTYVKRAALRADPPRRSGHRRSKQL